MGEVDTWAVDTASLLVAAKAEESMTAPENAAEVKQLLLGMTEDICTKLKAKGLKIYFLKLTRETLCYLPCGWLIIEKASSDASLIYGASKRLFFSTPGSKKVFKCACDLQQVTENSNMKKVFDMMSK